MAGAEEEEWQHFNGRLQRIAAAATAFDLIRIKHAREREETDAQLAAYDEATSSYEAQFAALNLSADRVMGLKSAGKRLSSLQPLEAPLRNNIRTPTWTRTDASRFAPNANNIRSREDGCFDSDASGGGLGDFSSDSDSPFNSGKWTVEENKAAKAAVETLAERVECPHLKGRGKEWTVDWQKVSEAVGTRSRVQCRSKLEKPFQKAKNNAVHAVVGKKTPKPWVPKPTGTTKPDGRIAKDFKSATCSCGACDNRYYGSTSWKSVAGLACKSCEQAQHPANHGWCGACRDPTRPHVHTEAVHARPNARCWMQR